MKRIVTVMAVGFLFFAAQAPLCGQDLVLGKIEFPRAYVHAGQDFAAGAYQVALIEKEGKPVFTVATLEGAALFEELAVVETLKTKSRRAFRLRPGLLRGQEYFRISVVRSDRHIQGFFLVKK